LPLALHEIPASMTVFFLALLRSNCRLVPEFLRATAASERSGEHGELERRQDERDRNDGRAGAEGHTRRFSLHSSPFVMED
jgi:hypothetical protein